MKRIPLWAYLLFLFWILRDPPYPHRPWLSGGIVALSILLVAAIAYLKSRKTVYIGGALTKLPVDKYALSWPYPETQQAVKERYEFAGRVCHANGYEPYVPHMRGTDPLKNADVSPSRVFWKDLWRILVDPIVFMFADYESLGAGVELSLAWVLGTRVVLIYGQGAKVSRMARGCPSVVDRIEYWSERHLGQTIRSWLKIYNSYYWLQLVSHLPRFTTDAVMLSAEASQEKAS